MKNAYFEGLVFPDNTLPKCFTNSYLYNLRKEVKNEYTSFKNCLSEIYDYNSKKDTIRGFLGFKDLSYNHFKGTEAIRVFASKKNGELREFGIPNPVSQFVLHWFIEENIDTLESLQTPHSDFVAINSRFFKSKDFLAQLDYYDNIEDFDFKEDVYIPDIGDSGTMNAKISNGRFFKYEVDISKFYQSLYTHSIAWNTESPNIMKLLQKFDILIRNTNGNETKGIIVGPYSSTLFAELCLAQIDKYMINKYMMDGSISYTRYVDDYVFYSDNGDLLSKEIRFDLEQQLSRIGLGLNFYKVKTSEFPYINSILQHKNSLNSLRSRLEKILEGIKETQLFGESKNKKANRLRLEFIESILAEIINSLNDGYKEVKYVLAATTNIIGSFKELDQLIFNEEVFMNKLCLNLFNVMFKHNFLVDRIGMLIIKVVQINSSFKDSLINNMLIKRNVFKSYLREIVDIWLIYMILYLDYSESDADDYVRELLSSSSILCQVLAIEYIVKNGKIDLFVHEILSVSNIVQSELKKSYGKNWIEASWISKYWLMLYNDSYSWKLHEIGEFKDTIFNKCNLDKLSDKMEFIHVFRVFRKNNIQFLDIGISPFKETKKD